MNHPGTSAIEHVIVTGDVTRPPECSDQTANITWLYHLVSEQIAHVTGVQPHRLVGLGRDAGRSLITFDGWLAANAQPESPVWHFEQAEATAWRPDNTVFVCFECPENLKARLESDSFAYLDVNIHPVRFADDLMFGVTGSVGLSDRIAEYVVDPSTFLLNAQFIKARIQRSEGFPPLPECGVVVGQVPKDRSLIRGGQMVTLDQYEARIAAFKATFGTVFFKPHPYCPAIPDFLTAMGIEPIQENIYHLLSHESVHAVCGISSSVLYEAPYFRKHGYGLEALPTQRDAVMLDDFTSTAFWRDALTDRDRGHSANRNRGVDMRLPRVPGRLRTLLNERWSFV